MRCIRTLAYMAVAMTISTTSLAAETRHMKVGDVFVVGAFDTVTIMNPDPIMGGPQMFIFGDSCSLVRNAKVKVIVEDKKNNDFLLEYSAPGPTFSYCPDKTLFFASEATVLVPESEAKEALKRKRVLDSAERERVQKLLEGVGQ